MCPQQKVDVLEKRIEKLEELTEELLNHLRVSVRPCTIGKGVWLQSWDNDD